MLSMAENTQILALEPSTHTHTYSSNTWPYLNPIPIHFLHLTTEPCDIPSVLMFLSKKTELIDFKCERVSDWNQSGWNYSRAFRFSPRTCQPKIHPISTVDYSQSKAIRYHHHLDIHTHTHINSFIRLSWLFHAFPLGDRIEGMWYKTGSKSTYDT